MRSYFHYSGIIWLAVIFIECFTDASGNALKISPVDLNFECAAKKEADLSKPPIILLHGLTGSKKSWRSIFAALPFLTDRKVCAADLRNHGDSPWNDETSVAAMAADTVHLLDSIQAQTAVIIGHSLGGKIAMHTAVNYPERVNRIVVEDISPELSSSNVNTVSGYLKFMNQLLNLIPKGSDEETGKKIILQHINDYFKLNGSIDHVELSISCTPEKCRWKTNVEGILNTISSGFSSFWTPTIGTYSGPALFIYGTVSPFRVQDAEEEIRKMFPKVKMVAVEGADHLIHSLFPQFEDEVIKFLQS